MLRALRPALGLGSLAAIAAVLALPVGAASAASGTMLTGPTTRALIANGPGAPSISSTPALVSGSLRVDVDPGTADTDVTFTVIISGDSLDGPGTQSQTVTLGANSGATTVTMPLTAFVLRAGGSYVVRVTATSTSGTDTSSTGAFSAPGSPAAPTITGFQATAGATSTTATMWADSQGVSGTLTVYAEEAGVMVAQQTAAMSPHESARPFTVTLTGIDPSSQVRVFAVAHTGAGDTMSQPLVLVTPTQLPALSIAGASLTASSISAVVTGWANGAGATLNAQLRPLSGGSALSSAAAWSTPASGLWSHTISFSGLSAGTAYALDVTASSGSETSLHTFQVGTTAAGAAPSASSATRDAAQAVAPTPAPAAAKPLIVTVATGPRRLTVRCSAACRVKVSGATLAGSSRTATSQSLRLAPDAAARRLLRHRRRVTRRVTVTAVTADGRRDSRSVNVAFTR